MGFTSIRSVNRIRMPWKRHLLLWKKKFGDLLYGRKWLNMGGGHHITKAGYDMEKTGELYPAHAGNI